MPEALTGNRPANIRSLKDKHWYWVDKAVVQEYVPRIGMVGFVVYSYLASMADSRQACYPSQKRIAEALGFSRPTVSKAIKVLKDAGLICVEKRGGRYPQCYRLLRVRCKAHETSMSTTGNFDVNHRHTNNTIVTRLINDTMAAENKKVAGNGKLPHKDFIPKTKEELLALDLAESLNDRRNLPLYLSYVRKYPESLLRRALGEVKEVPANKIKKSRAALFNHLIQSYDK